MEYDGGTGLSRRRTTDSLVKNAWKDLPGTVYSVKNVIPVDDDVQQSISEMDESALSDMMSHVERRAREVCAPALTAMKQRQVELKRKLAEKNTLMNTSKDTGNEQINKLRNKQDLLEK
eukprot:9407557-Ditylum_brightwellii.AAC.1